MIRLGDHMASAGFVAIEVQRHHLTLDFMGTSTAASYSPLYTAVIEEVTGLDSIKPAFGSYTRLTAM